MTPGGTPPERVVIIGAGVSGLALAGRLVRAGIRARILDSAPRIAETWRRRHQQLRLNTHRHFSRLPGRPIPRDAGPFPGRDAVVRYLEAYARDFCPGVELGVRVEHLEAFGDLWHLHTSAGEISARHVVVATGRERVPVIPCWPGRDRFTGTLIHAADFGDARSWRDSSVLVVGTGNSGVDVLNHLVRSETRALRVAVRSATTIVPTWFGGVPVQRLSGIMRRLPGPLVDRLLVMTERAAFGDLSRFGLPRPAPGAATRLAREGVTPPVDDGFVDALTRGRVSVVPAVAAFDQGEVVLADRRKLQPDVVICATGYSPGLENMVGHLDVLDHKGVPRFQGAEADARHPGLWFLGMRPRLSGNFHAACGDSRALARRIARVEGPQRRSGYTPTRHARGASTRRDC